MTVHLYLAHPIASREDIRRKEIAFEKRTGIELINPFYDGDEAEAIKKLDSGEITIQEYAAWLEKTGKGKYFVRDDLKAIDRSDGVVAVIYRGTPTIGTSQEVLYAVLRGKPVFFVTNFPEHLWIRWDAEKSKGFVVDTFSELEDKLMARYGLTEKTGEPSAV